MLASADENRSPTHAGEGATRVVTEMTEVSCAEVRQLVLLPVTPDVLDRIEFRCLSRQVLEREVPPLGGDEFAHEATAMRAHSDGLLAVARQGEAIRKFLVA